MGAAPGGGDIKCFFLFGICDYQSRKMGIYESFALYHLTKLIVHVNVFFCLKLSSRLGGYKIFNLMNNYMKPPSPCWHEEKILTFAKSILILDVIFCHSIYSLTLNSATNYI